MAEFNLEEAEKLAADIETKMKASVEFMAWIQSGGEIIDEHDTYPPELYEAACHPENMKVLLAAVAQLRPLKEELLELLRGKKAALEDLRAMTVRHDGAHNWALNNAKTLHSHLAVCRHDDVKGLETQLAKGLAKGFVKALTFAQHKTLRSRR